MLLQLSQVCDNDDYIISSFKSNKQQHHQQQQLQTSSSIQSCAEPIIIDQPVSHNSDSHISNHVNAVHNNSDSATNDSVVSLQSTITPPSFAPKPITKSIKCNNNNDTTTINSKDNNNNSNNNSNNNNNNHSNMIAEPLLVTVNVNLPLSQILDNDIHLFTQTAQQQQLNTSHSANVLTQTTTRRNSTKHKQRSNKCAARELDDKRYSEFIKLQQDVDNELSKQSGTTLQDIYNKLTINQLKLLLRGNGIGVRNSINRSEILHKFNTIYCNTNSQQNNNQHSIKPSVKNSASHVSTSSVTKHKQHAVQTPQHNINSSDKDDDNFYINLQPVAADNRSIQNQQQQSIITLPDLNDTLIVKLSNIQQYPIVMNIINSNNVNTAINMTINSHVVLSVMDYIDYIKQNISLLSYIVNEQHIHKLLETCDSGYMIECIILSITTIHDSDYSWVTAKLAEVNNNRLVNNNCNYIYTKEYDTESISTMVKFISIANNNVILPNYRMIQFEQYNNRIKQQIKSYDLISCKGRIGQVYNINNTYDSNNKYYNCLSVIWYRLINKPNNSTEYEIDTCQIPFTISLYHCDKLDNVSIEQHYSNDWVNTTNDYNTEYIHIANILNELYSRIISRIPSKLYMDRSATLSNYVAIRQFTAEFYNLAYKIQACNIRDNTEFAFVFHSMLIQLMLNSNNDSLCHCIHHMSHFILDKHQLNYTLQRQS